MVPPSSRLAVAHEIHSRTKKIINPARLCSSNNSSDFLVRARIFAVGRRKQKFGEEEAPRIALARTSNVVVAVESN